MGFMQLLMQCSKLDFHFLHCELSVCVKSAMVFNFFKGFFSQKVSHTCQKHLILNIPRDFALKKKFFTFQNSRLTLIGINLITQLLLILYESLIFCKSLLRKREVVLADVH